MKRFLTTLSVLIGFVLMGSTVSAQAVITGTGPGSNNEVITNNSSNCTSQTNNQVEVDNSNQQNSGTGEADVDGSTNGGGSTTGGSSNSSNTDTSIGINNGNACVAQAQPEGGKGAGTLAAKPEVKKTPAQVSKTPVGGVAAGGASQADTIRVISILTLSGASVALGLKRFGALQIGSTK